MAARDETDVLCIREPSSPVGLRAVVAALVGVIASPVSLTAQPIAGSVPSEKRIVHRFDFDERDKGNLEDVPKYWEPLRLRKFPHYAYGEFDFNLGRTAPPSFHLACEGRNVAYRYTGIETRIRRNTDYRIIGFVRADRLAHARACLSAHFVDKFGRAVVETLVRSRYVGGEDDGWNMVELHLPAAPVEAYTISLVAWVLQEPNWNTGVTAKRHIPRRDVSGGAWFDDITIYALPHIELTTGVPGNVLTPDGRQELRLVLADDEDPTLYGRLSITAADGGLVEMHSMAVALEGDSAPVRIPVRHLTAGLYHVRLDVFGKQSKIVSRSLTFARVAALGEGTDTRAKSFGVVIDPRFRSDPAVELVLLRQQMVRSAKLPVWTGLVDEAVTPKDRRATDRLLQELVKSGFFLTGVFFGPPSAIARSDGAYVRPLIELLAGSPGAWQEHLAAVVAPYASAFRWWQLGPDPANRDTHMTHEAQRFDDERSLAITQLRDAMLPFITMPRLAAPTTAGVEPEAFKLPVQQVTLALGNALATDGFASQIARARSLGYEYVSTYVEPLSSAMYSRLARLADWSQRVILARFSGADTVFVPQTWHVKNTPQGATTEPDETYIVLRTIAAMLGDGKPGAELQMSESVRALAFDRDDLTTLVLWDPDAPPEGRTIAIQMGQADRQVDLWGRATPLKRDKHGRQIVRLTAVPIFVPGIERWLIEFRTALKLTPSHVESGTEIVKHVVTTAYRGDRPVSGSMFLKVPKKWHVAPRTLSFNVLPQRVDKRDIQVRYPHNETAGEKNITARITLTGSGYYMEVPLLVEVGVVDLDVWGTAVVEHGVLVLRHIIRNRSESVLSFRASAAVPGRERQYRPISNLRPGDTQTVEYHFSRGVEMIGRNARLVLREVNDGPRNHNINLPIR